MAKRLAILATHPIQHFVPQYASLARSEAFNEVRVYFESDRGLVPQYDPGFGKFISWGGLALGAFDHEFLGRDGLTLQRSVARGLGTFDPDVVLVYGYTSGVARQGIRWARRNRKVLAYCSDSELRQQRNRLREALLYPAKRHLVGRSDIFMTVGDANEEYYRHFGVDPSKFIRTSFPIDIVRYRSALAEIGPLRRDARKRMDIGDDQIALLVVGKLQDFKRQADLIDAVALLNRESRRSYVAVIAGSGPEEEALEARAARLGVRYVRLLGFVPHTDLPAVYAAADIYIQPSSRERHSLAISEAVFLGLPAIVSDRCGSWGPTDDVQVGTNGLVFPVGDISILAQSIRAVAEVEGVLERYGSASRLIGAAHQRLAHSAAWVELSSRIGR